MKKAIICSPYSCGDLKTNIETAKKCAKHAAENGFVPIVPHLYFTQFLQDAIPDERELGIKLGLESMKDCDELWIFEGNGISEGMKVEIEHWKKHYPEKKIAKLEEITC